MSIVEELSRIKKYKSVSRLPHQVIEIDKLADKDVMKIFYRLLPTDIIQIGPFYIYYLLKDVDRPLWNGMLDYISTFYSETCRGEISKSYQRKFEETNLMVVCVSHDEGIYKKYGIDVMNGFLLAKYDVPEKMANIILICFQNIYSFGDAKDKKFKLGAGLFIHCLGLNILRQLEIKNIYLEASVKELIPYYYNLGYKLGKKRCDEDDKITNLHDRYDIQTVIEKLPKNYADDEYDFAYRMKWCGFHEKEICFRAFQSFRENVYKVSEEMLKSKVEIKDDMYLGPLDMPNKYRIIKELKDDGSQREYIVIDNKDRLFRVYIWKKKNTNILPKIRCIQKVKKYCKEISCYVEDFEIDDNIYLITEWRDGYETLEDYLTKRLELEEMNEDMITKNIYRVIDKLLLVGVVPKLSEKNIWISPDTLNIYIPKVSCDGDEEKNREFVEELHDTIFDGNRSLGMMNKEIVKKTRDLIKILKSKNVKDMDKKIRSFGEELNQANFKMNNLSVDIFHVSSEIIDNIKMLSDIAITKDILSVYRKKKWIKILKKYIDEFDKSEFKSVSLK